MAQTTFIDVICNYALVEISDVRLQKEMQTNPARFFRKMSYYLLNAIPRFNRPPEAREWLKFTAPLYDDYDLTVPDDYVVGTPLTVNTDLLEFDMVNAVKLAEDGFGGYEYIPLTISSYDSATGIVILSAENALNVGDNISIDFYTDGYFDRDLDYRVLRILGLLVQLVWENRFINDFLNQQPKIKDRSFDVGNEANHMRASTERMRFLNHQVNSELRSFEQYCAYNLTVLNEGVGTMLNPPDAIVNIERRLDAIEDSMTTTYIGDEAPDDSTSNLWVDTDE